jgi:putative transposon-encoded protein
MKRNFLGFGCLLVAIICFGGCKKEIKKGDFIFMDKPFDNLVSVVRYTGNSSIVEIPKEINGREVREIESGAFKDLPNLLKVSFLTDHWSLYIRSGAFENCPKLYNISAANQSALSSISTDIVINCPSMFEKTASSGSGSTSSNNSSSGTSKSGVVGTYNRVSAQATGGNTNRSSWKTVNDSRLGPGVNIPSRFVVNSNGTASAGSLSFTWSGSGSNITFTYSGSGNTRASYNASRGEIYMQLPTVYNGTLDLLAITYR